MQELYAFGLPRSDDSSMEIDLGLAFVFILQLDLGKPTCPLEDFDPLDTECPTQPTGSHGNVRDKGSPRSVVLCVARTTHNRA
jgi:hypothetical protein